MPREITQKERSVLESLPPLEVRIGDVPLLITPDLFLQAARCRTFACRGCVEVIDYDKNGTPESVIIRWLEDCGDTPKGRGTSFDVTPGQGRIFERAQDNCLEVVVFFIECAGQRPRIIKILIRPRNKACCREECGCHGSK